MKTTITQWIIKLLQFELSYRTLKIATVVYFGLFLIAYMVCLFYLLHSAVKNEPITVTHMGAGYVVINGTNKIRRIKIMGKR